jgi:hypothetical protein
VTPPKPWEIQGIVGAKLQDVHEPVRASSLAGSAQSVRASSLAGSAQSVHNDGNITHVHEASHSRSGHEPSSDVDSIQSRTSRDTDAKRVHEVSTRSTHARSTDSSSAKLHQETVQGSDPSKNDVLDVCIVSKSRFQIVSVTPVWVRERTPEDIKAQIKGVKGADEKEKELKDG